MGKSDRHAAAILHLVSVVSLIIARNSIGLCYRLTGSAQPYDQLTGSTAEVENPDITPSVSLRKFS